MKTRCWLRHARGLGGGAVKHCHQKAVVEYHGILVCRRHKRQLDEEGPQILYVRTY
jgi:hypothetical protein